MNHCSIQQNSEMRSSFASATTMFMPDNHLHRRGDAVVCPKPRRVGILGGAINGPSRSCSWHLSHQAENFDSKAGSELLDIILAEVGDVYERSGSNNTNFTQLASSPPFFCGSPPSRVANPLIQDARFREEKVLPSVVASHTHPLPSSPGLSSGGADSPLSPTSATARKGGCVRANFSNNPAVRIEGFDCLDRDHGRNCSIPALA